MRRFLNYIAFIFVVTILFSCKREDSPIDFQTEYFGLTPNRYVVYDVTRIWHDDAAGIHDTIYSQLKTYIGDTVIDNEGRIARKFIRSLRNNPQEDWVSADVWTAIIDDYRAELVEENQRKIKLVFVPSEEKTWDVNAFNPLGRLEATFFDINLARVINGVGISASVGVLTSNVVNQVEYRKKYEIYGKNIGLVSRYEKDFTLKIDPSTPGPDTLQPLKGYELFYSIKSYGIE
jgi:hypothetical protein